jgi:hypothetical protein
MNKDIELKDKGMTKEEILKVIDKATEECINSYIWEPNDEQTREHLKKELMRLTEPLNDRFSPYRVTDVRVTTNNEMTLDMEVTYVFKKLDIKDNR